MLNLDWMKAFPWILIAVLAALLAVMSHLYLTERDDFTSFKAESKQAGIDGQDREDKLKQDHNDNLIELEKTHEHNKDIAVADAVRNYKLRHQAVAGTGGLCGASPNQAVGDGAQQELISVEPDTLRECAKDSGKVGWFQDYCKLNRCPIED